MADLLIAVSLMFAGAGLALSGFALGQLVERRRWLAWVRPKKAKVPEHPFAFRISGGYRGPVWDGKPVVPPTGGSSVRAPRKGAADV